VDGVPVMSTHEAVRRFGLDARVAVTICSPGASAGAVIRELAALGCRNVTSFLPLLWATEGGLPHFGFDRPSLILEERRDIRSAFGLLSDELSRSLFVHQLRMRLTGELGRFDHLVSPSDQYFPRGLLSLRPQERMLDGGAFDGDTLRTVIAAGPFERVVCVEPDPGTFSRLKALFDTLPRALRDRVSLVDAALASRAGTLRFDSTGGIGAALADTGTIAVRAITIGEAMGGMSPTLIKLDIEGGEADALAGAAATISDAAPRLAVCVYHRPTDLWAIPLFIRRTNPAYRFHLRCHAHDGLETVLYAMPAES
jgi:FkbM family methyltransferase